MLIATKTLAKRELVKQQQANCSIVIFTNQKSKIQISLQFQGDFTSSPLGYIGV